MMESPDTLGGLFGPEWEPDWAQALRTVRARERLRGKQRWILVRCGHCGHELSEMRAQKGRDGLQVEVRRWQIGAKGECTSAHGGRTLGVGLDGKVLLRPKSSGWHWTCAACPGGGRRLAAPHRQFVEALTTAEASAAKRPAVRIRGGQARASV